MEGSLSDRSPRVTWQQFHPKAVLFHLAMPLFMDDLILTMTKADKLLARMISDWQVEQLRITLPLGNTGERHLDSVGEVLSL